MSETLNVFYDRKLVGRINRSGGQWRFQYDENWLASADSFAVSVSLPLRREPFDNDRARPFFANLLPEGGVRDAIARSIGVSINNDFELLKAFGGECAGALSITDQDKPDDRFDGYTLIEEDTLYRKIKEVSLHPFLLQDGMRLSLAGAQHKMPVFYDEGKFYLPKGDGATTHIVKPPMAAFSNSVENEFFCMRLAAVVGLPVADVRMVFIKDIPVLLCARYDRVVKHGRVVRFHQEDFCQALGFSYDQKYESEGGPGLKDCFRLLEQYGSQPMADKMNLLRWIIFNQVIGNADAHAKNISLLYRDRQIRLAPFYDLLSTAVYPALASRMAMKIGGENRAEWVKARHWERLADDVQIKASLVAEEYRRLSDAIMKQGPVLADELHVDADDILKRIQKGTGKKNE